jgi:hypothetical protein
MGDWLTRFVGKRSGIVERSGTLTEKLEAVFKLSRIY